MNERLRRHARLIAGTLALLLVAGVGYAVRSAGSARAQGAGVANGHPRVRMIAPILASAATRAHGQAASRLSSQSRRRPSVARANTIPAGVPTPAPSRRGAALALRQITGLSPAQVTSRPICPRPTAGHATCAAEALVLRASGARVRPQVSRYRSLGNVSHATPSQATPASVAAITPPKADTPAYLQQAYDLSYLSLTGGGHDTVAVVDAYDDPSAATDLAYYRSYYGLPPCPTTNGCFRKVGQTGGGPLPRADAGWEQEIALDLDAVSSICPNCHILLVEANSNSFSDLQAAMQSAANLGANQISASWWGVSSGVPLGFGTFPGVATVAATGDAGYPGAGANNYPAAIPGITAAGGTSLAPAAVPTARGFGEAAWSWNGVNGGGSGCDLQFPRPSYQPAAGCVGRAYADLSADADPTTGLTVYDHGTWSLVGGTSLSTPLIAAYYAITGVAGASPAWAYDQSATLNDVSSGSSGNCSSAIAYICDAGVGYDGPTGAGSISGSVTAGAPGIGGPAVASNSSPTYTTGVSSHGATITGGVYRNRLDTKWWIEYGTTSYGHQTAATDIGSGSAPVAVTANLSGLSAGTTYHYRLVAQNSVGTTYGFDYTFTTQPGPTGGPTASFTVSPGTPAVGTAATFDASTSTPGTIGTISSYSWNFGDGATDTTQTPTDAHTYASRGMYTVTLTVTSNGQTDTSTQTVTVDNSAASFTPSSSAVPAGTTIAFNAGASTVGAGGSITDYSWNFGDGSVIDAGTNAMQSHSFPTPGTYIVTLTTTDDLNVTSTSTAQITVAAFTATPAPSAPSKPVTFSALNPSAGSMYLWHFDDGTPDQQGATVAHPFAGRGHHTVSLTVDNGTPITASVTVDTLPSPQFTPSPAAVLPGTTVSFDASASQADPNGSISDYSWNFGDGTPTQDTAGAATTSHTFTARGIYTVTLTTTDDLGATASEIQQVIVDQPTAAFAVSPSSIAPNVLVSFDASATSDPDSAIAHYSWDFGDGTPAQDAGQSAGTTHAYAAAGTYTVTLTVTDALGLSDTTSQQVVVSPAVTQTSNPPPTNTSTTTTTPVPVSPPTTTTPTPPPTTTRTPLSVSLQVIGTARQRLTRVLAHGLRLGLTVNQHVRASVQLLVPQGAIKHAVRNARRNPNKPVVLQRTTQTLGAGKHSIMLRLSPAAARRLNLGGAFVLTVRVVLSAADGTTVTRTARITLTR